MELQTQFSASQSSSSTNYFTNLGGIILVWNKLETVYYIHKSLAAQGLFKVQPYKGGLTGAHLSLMGFTFQIIINSSRVNTLFILITYKLQEDKQHVFIPLGGATIQYPGGERGLGFLSQANYLFQSGSAAR